MILSVSRKTDIPAFYVPWFFNRMREGFCYTQNPMNAKQISKVSLQRDVLDGMVFWTKNPRPMLKRLSEIAEIPYYFQFTLTAYGQDMEAHLPRKKELVHTFLELSRRTSSQQLVWRYDPIILNEKYTIDYHLKYFAALAKELQGSAQRVVISFVCYYDKIANAWKRLGFQSMGIEDKNIIAEGLACSAKEFGFTVESCAEDIDLQKYGIVHSRCIDDALLSEISGVTLIASKDAYQRTACGCVRSVDIGMYNSCPHGCHYCYASYSEESIRKNMQRHDPEYPLLLGKVPDSIEIKVKKQKSFVRLRKNLLDV